MEDDLMEGGIRMVYAAVLAGGIGNRMGANLPKQYLKIGGNGGIPIIALTVGKFVHHPEVVHTVVLTPEAWVDYTKELLETYLPETDKYTVIPGGETRNDTLYNSISFFESHYEVADEDIILTHDAVRPFVTTRILDDNIRMAKQYGACNTVIPATDTIMVSQGGEVIESIPDRSTLYQVQTPQTFRLRKLKSLMERLTPEETKVLTDGSKIFLMNGEPCYLVQGEVYNMKITYPTDMAVANALYEEVEQ